MAGLCEGGNEPPGSLKANAVSTTSLFSVDGIVDNETVFGEMRQMIRHRLPDIRLTVGENLGKTNQIKLCSEKLFRVIPCLTSVVIKRSNFGLSERQLATHGGPASRDEWIRSEL
ncbi:hypothetical protein ANN_03686 [Periplaneta americana]|uniref:Uncharacterized protein n=1 Tax=Periplaneta americana TaxID=6978 RepID=A0ABQ8U0W8_PERAM|nr:hypothetical protein ANN_03686 [Periplaneta americana]